jgi:uncharacterized membrane protein YeaQ/YmgE (transglycosylase-associated protein family)
MSNSQDLFYYLALCALLGAAGQLTRIVIGIKKMVDEASEKNSDWKSSFVTSRLVLSICIGAVSGILAAVIANEPGAAGMSKDFMLGIMAAGYAGADFIEGAMKKYIPSDGPTTS